MWKFVYENDSNGNEVSGSKKQLIKAINNGSSVKALIVYEEGERVTSIQENVVFIRYGEVFAEISWTSAN